LRAPRASIAATAPVAPAALKSLAFGDLFECIKQKNLGLLGLPPRPHKQSKVVEFPSVSRS
jgi:hypothetical protein